MNQIFSLSLPTFPSGLRAALLVHSTDSCAFCARPARLFSLDLRLVDYPDASLRPYHLRCFASLLLRHPGTVFAWFTDPRAHD